MFWMKKRVVLFVVFTFILLTLLAAATLWLYLENEKLRGVVDEQQSRISVLSGTLTKANESIRDLNHSLQRTREELYLTSGLLNATLLELNDTRLTLEERGSELLLVREELNMTKNLLNVTKTEFAQLSVEVAELEESINESIQWFRENSFLPGSADWLTYRVQSRCIKNNKLNLACVSYVMGQKLGFAYISESGDRLFSIDEIVSRRGGDCEDFSLLLKALLNTLKSIDGDAVVEAWASGSGRYIVYEEREGTATTQWYVDGEGVQLATLDTAMPYVVCFAMDYYYGHCIVAVSEKNITSISDLHFLEGAALFEPQNGMYLGKIGKELALCGAEVQNCERTPGRISFVISDSDLYQFVDGEWKSYDLYMQKAARMEEIMARAQAVE